MSRRKERSLAQVLTALYGGDALFDGQIPTTAEDRGDLAFVEGDFDKACEAYAEVEKAPPRLRAKAGFLHGLLERWADARPLLTDRNVGDHPSALAMLASVTAHNETKKPQFGGKRPASDEAWKDRARELLSRALAVEQPPRFVFRTYFDLYFRLWTGRPLEQAVRAASLYPAWADAVYVKAREMRIDGRVEEEGLEALLPHLSTAQSSLFEEIFLHAVQLHRWDVAHDVTDKLQTQIEPADTEANATLDEVRSYVDLGRGLDGDAIALERGYSRLEPRLKATGSHPRTASQQDVAKLALRIAIAAGASERIASTAREVLDRHLRADEGFGMGGLDDWSAMLWISGGRGPFHVELPLGLSSQSDQVAAVLDAGDAMEWDLLVALDHANRDSLRPEDREVIESFGAQLAPAWATDTTAQVLLEAGADDEVGGLIARMAVLAAADDGTNDGLPDQLQTIDMEELEPARLQALFEGMYLWLLERETSGPSLPLDLWGSLLHRKRLFEILGKLAGLVAERSGSRIARFYQAISLHEQGDLERARGLYEQILEEDADDPITARNLGLVLTSQKDLPALRHVESRMLALLKNPSAGETRLPGWLEDVRAAIRSLESNRSEVETATEVRALLAQFPPLSTSRIEPSELSLLEAASLVALLRAGEVDHARWSLSPLSSASRPFEPGRRFISTLFSLAHRGVIGFSGSTPMNVFGVRDGAITAHLSKVTWQISPRTLELHRAIRDLPRSRWPEHWTHYAPILARDLGVDELVGYLGYLATQRDLPDPPEEEVREIYRIQLESLALAQGYYLTHKTIRETLDYQAAYKPGWKQVQTRMVNLLRGNGEKAVSLGWDTRYERIRDLPPSLLFEALHDVLTGWGRRAFDEPIFSLPIHDAEPPATRH